MKNIALLILLFVSIASLNAQFEFEHEFEGNGVTKMTMQDQEEYFIISDSSEAMVTIVNTDYEVLHVVPLPDCERFAFFGSMRSDIDSLELGLFCGCINQDFSRTEFLMDTEGTIVKEFIPNDNLNGFYTILSSIDDRYIIDYDGESNTSFIYNTQSLELIDEMDQMRIRRSSGVWNDSLFYYGIKYEVDSIYIFDEALNVIKEIPYNFQETADRRSVDIASYRDDANELKMYIYVEEYSSANYQEYNYLIDEEGEVLKNFTNYSFVAFHKYQNVLQIGYYPYPGKMMTYSLPEKEVNTVFDSEMTNYIFSRSFGKYIGFDYISGLSLGAIYDYQGEQVFLFEVENVNFLGSTSFFYDHTGSEYMRYIEEVDGVFNTIILKEFEYFQTIPNSNSVSAVTIPGESTQLIVRHPSEENRTELLSLNTTQTEDEVLSKVSLYPNPVLDKLNITTEDDLESYLIYSLDGKRIQKGSIETEQPQIDVQALQEGIYFIEFLDQFNNSSLGKFVKID